MITQSENPQSSVDLHLRIYDLVGVLGDLPLQCRHVALQRVNAVEAGVCSKVIERGDIVAAISAYPRQPS